MQTILQDWMELTIYQEDSSGIVFRVDSKGRSSPPPCDPSDENNDSFCNWWRGPAEVVTCGATMPLHADGLAKLLPDPNGPEWAASNARRIELIGKDLHGGLTDVEQVEYEALEELADEIQSFLSPFREVDEEEERLLDERLRAEEEPIG